MPYVNEGRDGYDLVEWVAAQPCRGAVVVRGWSYSAASAWLTALERPPHLRALVVHGTPGDPHTEFPTGMWSPMYCWHRMSTAGWRSGYTGSTGARSTGTVRS